MAILAECPICKRRQKLSHKVCKYGEKLDNAKRSNRVRYWITYRLPDRMRSGVKPPAIDAEPAKLAKALPTSKKLKAS